MNNWDFPGGEPCGEFEITGGKMRVSDPCYSKAARCGGVLESVKDGVWEGYAFMEDHDRSMMGGNRVKALAVKHAATDIKLNWSRHRAPFEVSVDSGQAGFFNEAQYPDGEPGVFGDLSTFYGRACEQTCSDTELDRQAGQVDEGVVSSSGYGDGGYDCTFIKDDTGQIVAAMIDFIPDEDEEEDEDDCWQDCAACGTLFHIDELDGWVCDDCRDEADGGDEAEERS